MVVGVAEVEEVNRIKTEALEVGDPRFYARSQLICARILTCFIWKGSEFGIIFTSKRTGRRAPQVDIGK